MDTIRLADMTIHNYKPENKGSLLNFAIKKQWLNQWLKDGTITQEEYNKELKRMRDELDPTLREVL